MNQDENFSPCSGHSFSRIETGDTMIRFTKACENGGLLRFWTLPFRETLRSNFRGAEMVTPFASFCNIFTPGRVSLAILATLSE